MQLQEAEECTALKVFFYFMVLSTRFHYNTLIYIPVQKGMAISCGSRAHLEKDSIAKVCFYFLLCTNNQIFPLFVSARQVLQLYNRYL